MGKVKLAHHNISGEKVCDLSLSLINAPALQGRIFISYGRLVTFSTSIAVSSPVLFDVSITTFVRSYVSLISSGQFTSLRTLCPSNAPNLVPRVLVGVWR